MNDPAELREMLEQLLDMGVLVLDKSIIAAVRELYLAAGDDPVALKRADEMRDAIQAWRDMQLAAIASAQAHKDGRLHYWPRAW
jgi:hypothetical protein